MRVSYVEVCNFPDKKPHARLVGRALTDVLYPLLFIEEAANFRLSALNIHLAEKAPYKLRCLP